MSIIEDQFFSHFYAMKKNNEKNIILIFQTRNNFFDILLTFGFLLHTYYDKSFFRILCLYFFII